MCMAYKVMAYIVMACIVMACIVMAYKGMAYIVMAYSHAFCMYDLKSNSQASDQRACQTFGKSLT